MSARWSTRRRRERQDRRCGRAPERHAGGKPGRRAPANRFPAGWYRSPVGRQAARSGPLVQATAATGGGRSAWQIDLVVLHSAENSFSAACGADNPHCRLSDPALWPREPDRDTTGRADDRDRHSVHDCVSAPPGNLRRIVGSDAATTIVGIREEVVFAARIREAGTEVPARYPGAPVPGRIRMGAGKLGMSVQP